MDIAKYIGLFLLKNNFCYIHGLGNLELKKKSASYDGQSLQGPAYEVVVTPAGSIDDNLANFIATNEQISISKAANALRDFSTQARADLAAGKDVPIPALGKFVEYNGKIQFVTDPHLQYTPPSIPVIKSATRSTITPKPVSAGRTPAQQAYDYNPDEDPANKTGINWGKIILVSVLAVVVIAAIIFGINYLQPRPVPPAEPEPVDTVQTQPLVTDTTLVADTMAAPPDGTVVEGQAPTMQEANGMLQFNAIINSYPDSARAVRRVKQLTGFGHNVSLVTNVNGEYDVIMPLSVAAADTTHVLDSLRRIFNPNGRITIQR